MFTKFLIVYIFNLRYENKYIYLFHTVSHVQKKKKFSIINLLYNRTVLRKMFNNVLEKRIVH